MIPGHEAAVRDAHHALKTINRDIADAKGVPGAEELIKMLTTRHEALEDAIRRVDEAEPAAVQAIQRDEEARAAAARARAALEIGSLDRDEALRLRDDFEHATQVARIRARERKEAEAHAASPLAKVRLKSAGRRQAQLICEGLMTAFLEGRTPDNIDKQPSPEIAAWEPLFQKRVLEQYRQAMQAKHGTMYPFAYPVERLEQAFAARRRLVETRRAALVRDLAAYGG